MTIARLLNRTCTITHRMASEAEDEYGNEIPATRLTVTVCEVQESRRSLSGRNAEQPMDGEVGDAEWMGFFPADTELSAADTVNVDGIGDFAVVGEPWAARNPRAQSISHVEVALRRTVGGEEGS